MSAALSALATLSRACERDPKMIGGCRDSSTHVECTASPETQTVPAAVSTSSPMLPTECPGSSITRTPLAISSPSTTSWSWCVSSASPVQAGVAQSFLWGALA